MKCQYRHVHCHFKLMTIRELYWILVILFRNLPIWNDLKSCLSKRVISFHIKTLFLQGDLKVIYKKLFYIHFAEVMTQSSLISKVVRVKAHIAKWLVG